MDGGKREMKGESVSNRSIYRDEDELMFIDKCKYK